MQKENILRNHYDILEEYSKRCINKDTGSIYDIFSDMQDDDLWNILLTREYDNWPLIKAILPEWPSDEIQRSWTGNCGMALSLLSCVFYKNAKTIFKQISQRDLSSVRLLDFGCGWGRIVRYFAKDIPTHLLYGCDPDSNILKMCIDLKVPGTFKISDYRPKRLPFDEKFDLIYAYSVFTHLSENVHRECLEAIHNALSPAGIAIITIRPRSYIRLKAGALAFVSDTRIDELENHFDRGKYVFSPHDIAPVDGEITYGEAAVPDSYIEDNWTKLFELIHPVNINEDPYQTPVVLRKK